METTTEQDISHGNANETHKLNSSDQLVEMVPIHDTPFTAVKAGEHWFLTLGKYRLTNQLASLEDCQKEATDASWNRIMQIILIMIEENKTKEIAVLKEQIENLKKQIH